jgi:MFS family permease
MIRQAHTPTAPQGNIPIFALFTANAISMTGNVLAVIAIPWFVLQTTGSAAQTGITGFFSVLPVVVAAFLGGGLVDRLGFKRASILADITSGVAIALIPLLQFTVGLAFWQLLVLVFIGNLLDAPGTTAREALVPELAERAGMRLERASAWLQAIERGSRLLGAPIAGFLIAFLNPSSVLWIDATTFFISAVLVAAAVPHIPITGAQDKPQRYLAGLVDGLRFIWNDRLIRAIVLTVMVTNFLDAPSGSVLLPVYVTEQAGTALDLGWMFAAIGGGALVGAIIFAAIGHRVPRRATFSLMFVIVGLRFWVLAAFPSLPVILITLIIAGIAAGPLNPIIGTIQFERIPAELRGRVLGAITAGAFLAMPFGILVAGFALERIGVQWVLIALGACYLVTTLSLLVNPAIREMDLVAQTSPTAETSVSAGE